MLKEGLPAFGPPRDGFRLFLGLLDSGEKRAGKGFKGESIGSDDLDQLAELCGLLSFDLLRLLHEGLEFGIVVTRLAGHVDSFIIHRSTRVPFASSWKHR